MSGFELEDLGINPESQNKSDDELAPIPFEDDDQTEINHAPLNIGGNSAAPAKPATSPQIPTPAPTPTTASAPKAAPKKGIVSSPDKITGAKTFFTKLHAGGVTYLNDQISEWLQANPEVVIKHTNMVVGDVIAKKTEPNLIITVWY